jgi:hypothetical protein
MPKNSPKNRRGKQRNIRIRGVQRREPDLQKITDTVIALALAQAEKDAQEEAERRRREQPDA